MFFPFFSHRFAFRSHDGFSFACQGYVAQFRLPRGDYEAKSCNLAEVLPVIYESVHLDMIGAGFSYYLAKSEPKHPSSLKIDDLNL